MKRLFLPFTGMLFVTVALMALAPPAAAAPSPCTIDIEIEGTEFVAPVNSTMPGAVTMQGSYTGTKPAFERAVVTLTGSVSTGWALSISPASITISGNVGTSGSFTVTVVAPAGSLHADVGMVAVAATMTAAGLQCHDTVEGISVTPQAYLDDVLWRLTPAELNMTGEIGSGSFELTVGALANVAVTISVAFDTPPGISIIAPSSISIPAPTGSPMNQTATVHVSASHQADVRNPITGFLNATAEGGLWHNSTIQSSVNLQRTSCFGCEPGSGVPWVPIGVSVGAMAVTAIWLRARARR